MNSVVSLSDGVGAKEDRAAGEDHQNDPRDRHGEARRSRPAFDRRAQGCAPKGQNAPGANPEIAEEQPREQHCQKHEMASDQETLRVDHGPEALRNSERQPPGQRAPQRSRPADNGSLESEDELGAASVRIEGRPHAERSARDRDRRHRDRHSRCIGPARVDPDQSDGVWVLRCRADRSSHQSALEKKTGWRRSSQSP